MQHYIFTECDRHTLYEHPTVNQILLQCSITSVKDGCDLIIGRSWHKYHFCCDNSFVMTNTSFVETKVCLSRQNFCRDKHVCHDKSFVATRIFCHDKSFVIKAYFCHGKRHVCHNKNYTCGSSLVATKVRSPQMSQQTHLCHDKYLSWQ